jgi:hypothetical protein
VENVIAGYAAATGTKRQPLAERSSPGFHDARSPRPIRQQARQLSAFPQRQLMRPGAFDQQRRVKLTVLEVKQKRHLQSRQIQAPGDPCAPQPQPARIDLTAQLAAAPAQQRGIHDTANYAIRTLHSHLARRAPRSEHGVAYLMHDMLPRPAARMAGSWHP